MVVQTWILSEIFVIFKDKSKDAHICNKVICDDFFGANIRLLNYNANFFFFFIALPLSLTIDQFFVHFPMNVWCPNFFPHAGITNLNAIHRIVYVIE